jgi:NTP pyrophosphatase (non-canonical NTP hydrolase)
MNYDALRKRVLDWALLKGILDAGDAKTQCLKAASEMGELCDNIAKGSHYSARDDIGDVLVTIIILARMINVDEVACLEEALKVIERREGNMVNGVFVKSE